MPTLEPITRIEQFLAKIAGANVVTPEPVTRIEWFLDKWANGGGGGGDASPIVGQGQVGYMVVGQEAASYTVSISLTNPRNAGYFMTCVIYELSAPEYEDVFNYVVGNIGQITSATGSTTITNCPRYFLVAPINTEGANVLVPSSGCSGTGGAAYVTPPTETSWPYAIYAVTGDGTATIDNVDYYV